MPCKMQKWVSLLLSLLLLGALLPRAQASATLYFTAVNDTLLDLNDKTMPFWQGGVLYVSAAAVDRTDLGMTYSYNREKMVAIVYRQRSVLYFDLAAGTIEDNTTHDRYSGAAIVRGDSVFFPVAVLAEFFDLTYSCSKVSYGYLVRLKDGNAVLSDSMFIDAASQSFRQRYNQYERARAADTAEQPETPAADNSSASRGDLTVYPLFLAKNDAACSQILNLLASYRSHATLLFPPETLSSLGGTVRRAYATGHAVALYVEAATLSEALSSIEEGNTALWESANLQTRLVYVPGADIRLREALREAGYCPLPAGTDLSYAGTQLYDRILRSAGSRSTLTVYLGTDESVSFYLASALNQLRAQECAVAALNEVIV